ncbi:EndoU domain-containing protein, partial [Planctomycetota bacterium]
TLQCFKLPKPGQNKLNTSFFPDNWTQDNITESIIDVIEKASVNPNKLIRPGNKAGTLVMEAIVDIEGKKGVEVLRVVVKEAKDKTLKMTTAYPITGDGLKYWIPDLDDTLTFFDSIPVGYEGKLGLPLTDVLK